MEPSQTRAAASCLILSASVELGVQLPFRTCHGLPPLICVRGRSNHLRIPNSL